MILYPSNSILHAKMQVKGQRPEGIKLELQKIAAIILGMDVSPQQPLMEAGLDSLAATEMHNAISKTFVEHEVPATFVYDYPTIDAMVQYFVKHEDTSIVVVPSTIQVVKEHISQSSEIVGMSCRYPVGGYGKTTLRGFIVSWNLILGICLEDLNDEEHVQPQRTSLAVQLRCLNST